MTVVSLLFTCVCTVLASEILAPVYLSGCATRTRPTVNQWHHYDATWHDMSWVGLHEVFIQEPCPARVTGPLNNVGESKFGG